MRISSIECGRVLAILAVMTIHVSPFANPFNPALWGSEPWFWLSGAINQLCRFAVPLFFLCAGYFLQPSLSRGAPLTVAWRYCRPLLLLWLLWSLVYLLMPFNPLDAVQQGYLASLRGQWQFQLARSSQRLAGRQHDPPLVPASPDHGGGPAGAMPLAWQAGTRPLSGDRPLSAGAAGRLPMPSRCWAPSGRC